MNSDQRKAAIDVCRDVYQETRAFYDHVASRMREAGLGFRILYGPPIERAPILFIGYQPGGRAIDASQGFNSGEHTSWPPHCDYAVASWPLAKRMQQVWGVATLEKSTGLNAIFFRAPSVRDWHKLDGALRAELEAFSLGRAENIVRAMEPKRLVIIGLGTFDRLADGVADLRGENKLLTKKGILWGVPATGIVHLSGARLSHDDLGRLTSYFSKTVSN